MHSITGRPERMPRMMVSIASGSCFMKRLERRPPRNFTKRSTRNMPGEEAGDQPDVERQAREPGHRRRRSTPPTASEIITKVATDQPSPARRKLARSRVVSSSGMKLRQRVGHGDEDVLLLLLAQQRHPHVVEVEAAGHALAADARQPLAVLGLHPQHDGDDEEAEPDRDDDRDDEDRADDDQVARHPIASRSRVPRPKYSARGMKCGRRCVHSWRPARVPSEFSPS